MRAAVLVASVGGVVATTLVAMRSAYAPGRPIQQSPTPGPDNSGARGQPASSLEMPAWAPGDWALLLESQWKGQGVARDERFVDWEPPIRRLARVAGAGQTFAYSCWRVEFAYPAAPGSGRVTAHLAQETGGVIRMQTEIQTRPPRTLDALCLASPAWPNGHTFCFPVFPLTMGESREFTETSLYRADGSPVRHGEDGLRYGYGSQSPVSQSVASDPWRPDCWRITVTGRDGKSVMRWLPGKPWWVQAWFYYHDKGLYRWALAGNSWDTPPLQELQQNLPERIGEWKRGDPEVIRIPEDGGELTSYTKTARWHTPGASGRSSCGSCRSGTTPCMRRPWRTAPPVRGPFTRQITTA
ncbi:MAG: hypothetical protein ACE5JM_15325 [Armatimonadota bacterium]